MLSFDPPYAPHFDYKVFAKEKEKFLSTDNVEKSREELVEIAKKTQRMYTKNTASAWNILFCGILRTLVSLLSTWWNTIVDCV